MNPAPRLAASFLVGIAAAYRTDARLPRFVVGALLVANKADASLSIVDPDDGRQLAVVAEGATTAMRWRSHRRLRASFPSTQRGVAALERTAS